jgi:hypothetical protein
MNADEMLGRLSEPLSRRRRLTQAFALVAGLTGAALVGLLWATEPDLPGRTQAAFGLLTGLGLGWAAYGTWALTRRTPLFALDRVVAAWMALVATMLLTGGAAAVRATDPDGPILPTVVAALLVVVAGANLVLARSRRAALLRRRDALAR